jgi:formyl-CoA transferase
MILEGDGEGQRVKFIRGPVELSRAPVTLHRAPPRLGQHTAEVFGRRAAAAADAR